MLHYVCFLCFTNESFSHIVPKAPVTSVDHGAPRTAHGARFDVVAHVSEEWFYHLLLTLLHRWRTAHRASRTEVAHVSEE